MKNFNLWQEYESQRFSRIIIAELRNSYIETLRSYKTWKEIEEDTTLRERINVAVAVRGEKPGPSVIDDMTFCSDNIPGESTFQIYVDNGTSPDVPPAPRT